MAFDTLGKRLSVLYDSGLVSYPDSSIDLLDRYFLTGLFGYYQLSDNREIWDKSYLGKIYYNIITILSSIGTVNNEDFTKVIFPLFNIYLEEEINTLDFDEPNMDAFENQVTFKIHCFNKLSSESSNAKFDADVVLDDLLNLVLTKLYANQTINNLTEGNFYITSERVKSGLGEDLFIPNKLIINLTLPYSQSKIKPLIPAYA